MSFFATTSASREAMLTKKRSLERDHASRDGMSDEKRQRPTLANDIVEAVKMDSLQKLCSTLEPLLRRVVGEEVERALAKFVPPKAGFR
jgi:DNA-binding Xre family transcriptional regulator